MSVLLTRSNVSGTCYAFAMNRFEYFDKMVIFEDGEEGMQSKLDTWINDVGKEGWELVSSAPLIAPNKDGIAYGTIGLHLIFKRTVA